MLGSRKGWLIAAVVAVIYLTAIALIERAGSAAGTTEFPWASGALKSLALSVRPETLAKVDDESTADSTAVLREIVAEVSEHRELYAGFVGSTGVDEAALPRLRVLELVQQQRGLKAGGSWATDSAVIGYRERPELEAVRLAGLTAGRVAALYKLRAEPERSRKLFLAELALGSRLFDARRSYAELSVGLGLMSEATTGLRLLAEDARGEGGDANRLAIVAFEDPLTEVVESVTPIWAVISSIDPVVVGEHNGDIPYIARKSAERVWRVEATLKLGRMRFDVGDGGTPGDQRKVARVLDELETDPDGAVALAARLAKRLTVEEYRSLR